MHSGKPSARHTLKFVPYAERRLGGAAVPAGLDFDSML